MTFQEILDGITRHRTNPVPEPLGGSDLNRKISEIEWALQALAEALRDREQELSAVAPHEHAGYSGDVADDLVDDVDDAFDEFEKRK